MKIRRTYSGMTLVEVVTSVMIISSIVLGMMISLNSFYYRFQQEYVVNNIREYGRMAMDEIVSELNSAVSIDPPSMFNGFSVISGTKINPDNGQLQNFRITARNNKGLLFDGDLPLDGNLELPDYGTYVDDGLRDVKLMEFKVEYDYGLASNPKKYSEAALEIDLIFGLDTKVAPGRESSGQNNYDIIKLSRRVFVPNVFIGRLKSAANVDDLPI